MSKQTSDYNFAVIGLGDVGKRRLDSLVDCTKVKFVDTQKDFESFIENFELDPDAIIIVGSSLSGIDGMELGQTLRACHINAHIVFVTSDPKQFSLEELKKNGYSRALLLPLDDTFFAEIVETAFQGNIRRKYKAIKMIDITPDENIDFGIYVYMPVNQKYFLITADGKLSEKKYERLQEESQATVFVDTNQVDKFYSYAAEKLAKLSESGVAGVSETERSERLKQSVQALFHNILDQGLNADFESGRDLTDQSNQVVQKFVETKVKVNLKQQIASVLNMETDSYSHAQSVSSFACLLSMAIGVGKPEELAIAGLFHDLGLAGFEKEPSTLTINTLSADDLERYKKHPGETVNILKAKKLILTPSVQEIIEKHHERVDGKGFPNQLPAHKIPEDAQLLAFCDWFEYIMQPKSGEKRVTPLEAVEIIQERAGLSIELILKIKTYFKSLKG